MGAQSHCVLLQLPPGCVITQFVQQIALGLVTVLNVRFTALYINLLSPRRIARPETVGLSRCGSIQSSLTGMGDGCQEFPSAG